MDEPPPADVLLSLSEAALYMELPAMRFMALVDQGRLPQPYPMRRAGGLRRLWRVSDLDRYLKRAAADQRYRFT